MAGGFLSLTQPVAARVVVSPLCGDEYEVSITGFAVPPSIVILSDSEESW
jgi:hypothetical protein